MEVHKQLKAKTTIHMFRDTKTSKKFPCDEKEMMVKELKELIIDYMEFHGMDSEFYLLDPQDISQIYFTLHDDAEYSPMWS